MNFLTMIGLPVELSSEVERKHEADVLRLLPLLGPLFGLAVLLYGVWDYLIDATRIANTLGVRTTLVLLGSAAYFPTRLNWTALQRCALIYGTHASAIIICIFILHNGFTYGLPGVTACVFVTSALTMRVRNLFKILAVPTLLFIALCALQLPYLELINGLMFYLFSTVLACLAMLVTRSFRLQAYTLEQQLLRQSRHDSLTGIYNRGYLTELAEREMAMSKRHNRPLSIAMIDIDHFKNVNDTYGHDIGDKTIRSLVEMCASGLRGIDHFGRIGGEEFVCVLPETGEPDALQCAERLRQSIENMTITIPNGTFRITVSIGVAVLHPHHADWDALLKDADTALYRAKQTGRNKVVLAGSI